MQECRAIFLIQKACLEWIKIWAMVKHLGVDSSLIIDGVGVLMTESNIWDIGTSMSNQISSDYLVHF